MQYALERGGKTHRHVARSLSLSLSYTLLMLLGYCSRTWALGVDRGRRGITRVELAVLVLDRRFLELQLAYNTDRVVIVDADVDVLPVIVVFIGTCRLQRGCGRPRKTRLWRLG